MGWQFTPYAHGPFAAAQSAPGGSTALSPDGKRILLEYVTDSDSNSWTAWLNDTSTILAGCLILCLLGFLAYSVYTRLRDRRRMYERMF